MALAAEYFVAALINALKGQKNVQCAYVKSNVVKEVEYFASPVELGPNGVVSNYPPYALKIKIILRKDSFHLATFLPMKNN
jgi:hypothetical protein